MQVPRTTATAQQSSSYLTVLQASADICTPDIFVCLSLPKLQSENIQLKGQAHASGSQ